MLDNHASMNFCNGSNSHPISLLESLYIASYSWLGCVHGIMGATSAQLSKLSLSLSFRYFCLSIVLTKMLWSVVTLNFV